MNIQAIKTRINEVCAKKDISKNKLAEILNVSSATLSNIENERTEKLSEEMLLEIWNYIKPQKWQIVETESFLYINKYCRLASQRHKMVGIIGSTGYGKTTALKHYYQSHKNTYFISCKNSMSAKQVLREIVRVMGINYHGTIYDLESRVIEELNKQVDPLLIIDEAGKLSQRVLQYLHDIKDESHAGIVLAGVEYFLENLERAAERNKQGMPEFFSRVSSWVMLQPPTRAEMKSICKANGVDEGEAANMVKVENYRKLSNAIENYLFEKDLKNELKDINGVNCTPRVSSCL